MVFPFIGLISCLFNSVSNFNNSFYFLCNIGKQWNIQFLLSCPLVPFPNLDTEFNIHLVFQRHEFKRTVCPRDWFLVIAVTTLPQCGSRASSGTRSFVHSVSCRLVSLLTSGRSETSLDWIPVLRVLLSYAAL